MQNFSRIKILKILLLLSSIYRITNLPKLFNKHLFHTCIYKTPFKLKTNCISFILFSLLKKKATFQHMMPSNEIIIIKKMMKKKKIPGDLALKVAQPRIRSYWLQASDSRSSKVRIN